ncbi:MAG: hypothetical protein GKS02_08315 [Alphaproteobacteria bacterium]|nr:hypothetical protein [Alphaproteobacteria bacterium]
MIDQLPQGISDSFLSGDYRKTVASLDDVLALVKTSEIGPEHIGQVTPPLREILQNAERVHNEHVEQISTGKGTVHHHTLVVRKVEEVVDELANCGAEKTGELIQLSAEIHYLMRDLDKAIAVLKDNEEIVAGDGRAMQLLATCYMLNDQPDEADQYIGIALKKAPDDSENIRLAGKIADLKKKGGRRRIVSGRWPHSLTPPSELETAARDLVLAENPFDRALLSDRSRVVTVGSCFANNLAAIFKRFGRDAFSFPFGEEINNTYTNRLVFEALSNDAGENRTTTLSELGMSQESVDTFGDYLRTSDILVYTLGVSQGFFDSDGKPVQLKGFGGVDRTLLNSAEYRNISVAENVANVGAIIECVRNLNPEIAIVFTVSPVPLARTFNSRAVVTSDCVSKSALRVTAAELTQGQADRKIYYWPSFEIAKWMAPHMAVESMEDYHFGADDLYSRHVSDHVVETIVRLFIEFSSGEAA